MTPISESRKKKLFRYAFLVWISFFLVVNFITAGTIISNGTSMNVLSGTLVTCNTDMLLLNGGKLTNQGTIILKGNLLNQNSSVNLDTLGTGKIEFSGTTAQTISGPNLFGKVTINNPNGVSLIGTRDTMKINDSIILSNGLLKLGNINLVLGPLSKIGGTPSSTKMVVPTGTGQFRRDFTSTSSFTFPVGDSTGAADYSPVTLSFSGATFGAGNYAGVNLVNAKYPNAGITGSYLNRYWNLYQNNITGSWTCNGTFTYTDGDIIGTEGELYCVRVNPGLTTFSATNTASNLLTANGLTTFSTFTGARAALTTGLTAFLEGPFDFNTLQMKTTLNPALLPASQPYSGVPWNYSGTESLGSIPAGMVDWILVELRHAANPSLATSGTIIRTRAALLKSNGSIVDTNNSSDLNFFNAVVPAGDSLYIVLKHRNHLAVMSFGATRNSAGKYVYDYSTNWNKVYKGKSGYKNLVLTGIWGLVAGDADSDGLVFNSDFNLWSNLFGTLNVYSPVDVDLDKNIFNSDFNIWSNNFGFTSQIP